jgi:hypothetical protein
MAPPFCVLPCSVSPCVCVCVLCVFCVCAYVCVFVYQAGGFSGAPDPPGTCSSRVWSRYRVCMCVCVCVCVCVCLISTCFCPVDTTRAKKRRTKVNFNHPLHLSACYLVEVCGYVCCRGVVWGVCVWGGGAYCTQIQVLKLVSRIAG